MLITIKNIIGSIRNVLGIVTDGLKMWLPFENSEILGEDVVTNGDFATDSDWTKGTGWTISSDKANSDGTQSVSYFRQDGIVNLTSTYKIEFTVSGSTSGTLNFLKGNGSTAINVTGNNTYTYFTKWDGSTGDVVFQSLNFVGSVDNVSVQEVTQIAPDTSGNSNSATLYTGKALSFDGVNDYVDLGSQSMPNATEATFAVWVNPVLASGSGEQAILVYGKTTAWFKNNNSISFYNLVSDSATSISIPDLSNKWNRLVITITDQDTVNVYIDGEHISTKTAPTGISTTADASYIGSYGAGRYLQGKLADFQIYDKAWTQADVTFDYDNPQHLVTDNSASSIALSNLKGYWHLSEGAGSFAYNSAVSGSELVTNGDFNSSGSWNTGAGWTIDTVNGKAKVDNGTNTHLNQNSLPVTNGKTYFVSFQISDYVSGSFQPQFGAGQVIASLGANGVYSYTVTSSVTNPTLYLYGVGDCEFSVDYISIKEVSVGTINGATWSLRQSTIPQLGLMDWSKPTIGSDVVTLISDPNDPSEDILDNIVRLREHSLNLDGSGYASVADDASINPTSAITIQCWIKSNTENNKGLVAKWNTSAKDYMLTKFSSTFRLYIGDVSLDSGTIPTSGWVSITATYDGSNMKTYINGVLSTTTSYSASIPNNTNVLEIGRFNSQVNLSYSERIDDVRIYDIALSSDEVEQNYNAGLSQHKTGSSFSDDFSGDYGN
jgi:hypothetical protein